MPKEFSDMFYTTTYKPVSRYANLIYIYGLADPRDHLIRYVGKTQCSLATRMEGHLKKPVNWRMHRWLKDLQWLGILPEIVAIEVCRSSEWEVREALWIRKLRDNLLNISPGEPAPEKTRPLGRGGRRTLRRAKMEALDVAEKSGPVRTLSREEIAAIYG
jgi:hypothetical protein